MKIDAPTHVSASWVPRHPINHSANPAIEREKCSAGACPQPRTRRPTIFILLRRPHRSMVIPAKACPVRCYGAGIQGRRWRRHRHANTTTNKRPQISCHRLPAKAGAGDRTRLEYGFSIRDLPPQSRQSLAEASKRLIPWIAPL